LKIRCILVEPAAKAPHLAIFARTGVPCYVIAVIHKRNARSAAQP
jgi:hypothetical protein